MPKLAGIQPEDNFKAMFIGPSGCGKTSALASFAEIGVVEFWDFDGRIRGILGCPWLDKYHDKIIYEAFPPKKPGMIMDLMGKVDTLQTMAMTGNLVTKTLVIDSLTSQTYAMLCQAKPLTAQDRQGDNKGKRISGYRMNGPEEYGFEADTTNNLMASLRSIPKLNLIVNAHIIPTWGKEDEDDPYSASIENGEKLAVRDKIGAVVPTYFDNVFRFDKSGSDNAIKHTVRFRDAKMARTTFNYLPNGVVDITNKNFYTEILMKKDWPKK